MTSSSSYPPSTLAYPHLNQLLDSLLTAPVSSTTSIFTLPTSITSHVSDTTALSSSTLPPHLFIDAQCHPVFFCAHTVLFFKFFLFCTTPLLQLRPIYNNFRQVTRDPQQSKPRHPKRPHLPSGKAGTPTRRVFHTAVCKQKLSQYNNDKYIDELLSLQIAEVEQITTNVNAILNKTKPTSKLSKLKSPACLLYSSNSPSMYTIFYQ